jgi:hypothetical protein
MCHVAVDDCRGGTVFHHPTMRQRIARERHDERVRDAERRAQVAAAMRDRHEPAPWPVVPDHVPARWEREVVTRTTETTRTTGT